MLVVVTVACVLLARTVRKAERQKEAVAVIERNGGWVRYDWEVGNRPQTPKNSLLRDLLGHDYFDDVVQVDWGGVGVVDDANVIPYRMDLMQLRSLTDLRELNLWDDSTKDLKFLEGLTGMKTLWLHCESIRDLSPLEGMRDLTRLWLDRTPEVYDLSPLADLDKLEYLFIAYMPTRDVSPLMNLKSLKELVLYTPNVNRQQIERLRLALPSCNVIHEEFTSAGILRIETMTPYREAATLHCPGYPRFAAPYRVDRRVLLRPRWQG